MERPAPSLTRAALAAACVAVFAAGVWPAVGASFTADDFMCLTRGRAPDPLQALRYFALDWGGSSAGGVFYRPLANLSFSLDGWLFGPRPAAFRLSGLVLHLVASVLVGWVGRRRWRLEPPAALLSGALFLLHPLHDQAILWVAARADLLCAIFVLLAFDAATGPRGAGRGAVFFAAALASKESAIVLPALVLVHGLLVAPGEDGRRALLRRVGPLAALVPPYLLLRHVVLGGLVGHGDPAYRTGGVALLKSAAKLLLWIFIPVESDTLEGVLRGLPGGLVLLAAVVLAGAAALALLALRRHPRAAAGLFWVALALAPVLVRPNAWYTYLPSAGFCWLLAGALFPSAAPGRLRQAAAAWVAALFALGLGVNARRFRAAADVADAVVAPLTRRTGPVLLVNAPAIVHGRYPVLTAPSHYAAAMSLAGSRALVVPLTHEHLHTGREEVRARWESGVLSVAMDTSEESFFVLDELVASVPGTFHQGQVVDGPRASYRIDRLDVRGRIAALTVLGPDRRAFGDTPVLAFSAGRLVTAYTTAGSSGVPDHFSSTSAPSAVTVMMSSWRMPISPGM